MRFERFKRPFRAALAALLAALLTLPAFALAESGGGYVGDMVVVNCDGWVSLKEAPSAQARRLAKVPLGATVTDCAWETRDFIYGCYGGQYGYIDGRYLASAAPAYPGGLDDDGRGADEGDGEDGDESLGDMVVIDCDEWVSLREQPALQSRRLAKVPLGAMVTECQRYDAEYVYGCYDGQYGYIVGAYLAPAAERSGGTVAEGGDTFDLRTRVELLEGEPSEIQETRYQTAMGFSFWYVPQAFVVREGPSEDGAEGVLVEGYNDGEYLPANLEFLTAEDTGLSGAEFLSQMPQRYSAHEVTEILTRPTDAGGEYSVRTGYLNDDVQVIFFAVQQGDRQLEAVAMVNSDLMESFGQAVEWCVRSVAFD